jgi:hypothetical protein
MTAIPSSRILRRRRHPSRLPFGSLRSAWTGPVAFAEDFSGYEGMAESELPTYMYWLLETKQ